MRIIVFISAMIMLSLALMPCADDMNSESQHTELSHSHDHEGPEGDLCSPLCFCHCCHVHFQIPIYTSIEEPNPLIEVQRVNYVQGFYDLPITSLFKPPRV